MARLTDAAAPPVDPPRVTFARSKPATPARRSRARRAQSRVALAFVTPYTILLVAFGVLPSAYAVYLAFTKGGAFVGFNNFANAFRDYRFLPAVEHVAIYLCAWLAALVVFVVVLAMVVQALGARWLSATLRFLYYMPGALAGASSVLLWLFLLDPTVSPAAFLLHALGFNAAVETMQSSRLPFTLALIAFWTGAGGWIIVMYGALNNISREVLEAARMDGAGPVRTAWFIQLPLLRKWIAYMVVLSLAGGTQLFVEPRILAQASRGVVTQDYSINQLAFLYAFRQHDFNGSAAISLVLLAIALSLSVYFVFKGGLFERG